MLEMDFYSPPSIMIFLVRCTASKQNKRSIWLLFCAICIIGPTEVYLFWGVISLIIMIKFYSSIVTHVKVFISFHFKQTKQVQCLTSVLCNLHHRAAGSLLSLRVILSIIIIARVKMIISFWQATLLWSTLAC